MDDGDNRKNNSKDYAKCAKNEKPYYSAPISCSCDVHDTRRRSEEWIIAREF
jgi:hypothetical protein